MSVQLPAAFMGIDLDRWREGSSARTPLTDAEAQRIAGAGAGPTAEEVLGVYEAVVTLVADRAAALAARHRSASRIVTSPEGPPPFVLGIAGSVAVGKSTIARVIQVLIERWSDRPEVQIVSTDAFLLPNAVLDAQDLTMLKGYPQSYDHPALLAFLAAVKSGRSAVRAPVYSHVVYDVVQGGYEIVDRPDVLILEGLNVLQVGPMDQGRATDEDRNGADASIVSDHLDMSIYVDAPVEDIEAWFVRRFAALREVGHPDPQAFYRQFAELSEVEAGAVARWTWNEINLPNLRAHIAPTRPRADLVLRKGADHGVQEVLLRRA